MSCGAGQGAHAQKKGQIVNIFKSYKRLSYSTTENTEYNNCTTSSRDMDMGNSTMRCCVLARRSGFARARRVLGSDENHDQHSSSRLVQPVELAVRWQLEARLCRAQRTRPRGEQASHERHGRREGARQAAVPRPHEAHVRVEQAE